VFMKTGAKPTCIASLPWMRVVYAILFPIMTIESI
jgi:hypothetical protein